MDVHFLGADGLTEHTPDELPALLARPDGIVWVDMGLGDTDQDAVLSGVFGFAEHAVRDCRERNHIAKSHVYGDHLFSVLHAPELGRGGHVHYVELDQFVGRNYVVTVHGPLNSAVAPDVAAADTRRVLGRLKAGQTRPENPVQLSAAIVAAMVQREVDLVARLARESGVLEQRVTDDDRDDDPEALLEDLFEVSHQLLAIRTIATHSAEIHRGLARRARRLDAGDAALITDLAERFDAVRSMAEGQREFVHGVIEFFQTRTSTHLAVAAQQLADTSARQNEQVQRITAWVAIVAVPTAVTGWFGQNVPYPGYGETAGFVASTVLIVVAAVVLYLVFRVRKWL
jgi:magnesium transporter